MHEHPSEKTPMITLKNLTKTYGSGTSSTTVLDRLNVDVGTGEIRAIVGPSGAGKSTLAHCISLLERPTSGSVIVNGEDLSSLPERELRVARRRIGTVFQSASLLQRKTAAENVAVPLEFLGVTKAQVKARAEELLERVGLTQRMHYYPHELSGGQQQRVGIARALALRPTVLLSDEATSGLDPETTSSVVGLLKELRDDLGLAIVFITHEMDTVLQAADTAALLDAGRIVEQGTLTDLLTDPSSSLGRALQPHLPSLPLERGAHEWKVVYDSQQIAPDWIQRLSARLREPVGLLSASIQAIQGVSTGSAVLGIRSTGPDVVHALAAEGLKPVGPTPGVEEELLTLSENLSELTSVGADRITEATR